MLLIIVPALRRWHASSQDLNQPPENRLNLGPSELVSRLERHFDRGPHQPGLLGMISWIGEGS